MSALPQPTGMTEAEYLAFERESEIKHEYLHGEIFAMTGASWNHNMICASTIISLGSQLRGKSCRISPSDIRVKMAADIFAYPDVSVICDDPQFADDEFDTLLNPVVIIEVLSPSTELYDRGEKFRYYRQLSNLCKSIC